MKQDNVMIYIKFMKPMDPRDLETAIRKCIEKGEINPVYNLFIMVDHKNLVYDGQRKYRNGKPIMEVPHKHLNKYEKIAKQEGAKFER